MNTTKPYIIALGLHNYRIWRWTTIILKYKITLWFTVGNWLDSDAKWKKKLYTNHVKPDINSNENILIIMWANLHMKHSINQQYLFNVILFNLINGIQQPLQCACSYRWRDMLKTIHTLKNIQGTRPSNLKQKSFASVF